MRNPWRNGYDENYMVKLVNNALNTRILKIDDRQTGNSKVLIQKSGGKYSSPGHISIILSRMQHFCLFVMNKLE